MHERILHTGEAVGVPGQIVAMLASAGATVLVWTGLALAWRRWRGWRARPASSARPRHSRGDGLPPPVSGC